MVNRGKGIDVKVPAKSGSIDIKVGEENES